MNKSFFYFLIICVSTNLFPQGSVLMMGGGGDKPDSEPYAKKAFTWFVQQADSGKIINIDVSDVAPSYAQDFINLGADPSSHSLQITAALADDSATYRELASAKGIFIEGGDQWDYVKTWKGTLTEDAIQAVFDNGGVIGGTSAGLAVLGEVVFDAKFGLAYPQQTARNPYDSRIHFTDDFLHLLPGVLTDTHFQERTRLGRLVPMLARRIQDNGQDDLTAIGVDSYSAFCVNPERVGTVFGQSVTILYKDESSLIRCQPGIPLTFTDIHFDQLIESAVYDLKQHALIDPGPYLQPAGNPLPVSRAYRDTVINGSDPDAASLGEVMITGLTSSSSNWYRGRLDQTEGNAVIPGTIIIPQLWNSIDFSPNRLIGGEYGVATNPALTAVYLDDECISQVNADGILTAGRLTYILDASVATYAGINPMKIPGIVGGRLHFLGENDTYDLMNHNAVVSIKNAEPRSSSSFALFDNYPNPFNPVTTFSYRLAQSANVSLDVYDTSGRQIANLVKKKQHAGVYRISWTPSGISSGIYFYRLKAGEYQSIKKCLFLK